MPDFYLTEQGDIAVGAGGDIAITETQWRDDVQQAYVRVMTDPGDFTLYPQLGAGLSQLFGRPQSPDTGALGQRLIEGALEREGRFIGKPFEVKAVPISHQSIRFDISITSGSREQIKLSVEQGLGVQ